MSDTPCLDSTDNILGQEFLTWLWYQSDVAPGAFVDKEGQPFSVSMEQRIVVQGGEGDAKETATVSALARGKKSPAPSSGLKRKNWPSSSPSRPKTSLWAA